MLSCREVSELGAKSLEKRLTWRERMGIRLHLMMCRTCQRVTKQMKFIRKAATQLANREDSFARLSHTARERIHNAIKQEKHQD